MLDEGSLDRITDAFLLLLLLLLLLLQAPLRLLSAACLVLALIARSRHAFWVPLPV
jgi:hypothetical protein